MSADLAGPDAPASVEALTVAEVCARSLAGRPDVVEQLRAQHVDDGAGRCRSCGRPEDYPPRPFPCPAARVVDAVDRLNGTR